MSLAQYQTCLEAATKVAASSAAAGATNVNVVALFTEILAKAEKFVKS